VPGAQLGPERLEGAGQRGMDIGARTCCSVQSILRNGLDRAFCPKPPVPDEKLRAAKARLDEAADKGPNFIRSRHALLPGWDHQNFRLASIGTDGWFRLESMAAIVEMRGHSAAGISTNQGQNDMVPQSAELRKLSKFLLEAGVKSIFPLSRHG
jgi:hypothetical protein